MRLSLLAALLVGQAALATNVQGSLPSGTTTWTLAQSPYVMLGDVRVPSGATLRIDPGVTVQAATTDSQAGGVDTSLVELIVEGALAVNGTPASPVTFTTSGAAGSWWGLRTTSTGTAQVTSALIEKGSRGFRFAGSGSLTKSTVRNCSVCVSTAAGTTVSVTSNTLTRCSLIAVDGDGALTLKNNLITYSGTTASGSEWESVAIWGTATVEHNTITQNPYGGLYFEAQSSSDRLTLIDNIIASNNRYGVYRTSTGTLVENHNDIWNQTNNANFYVHSTTLSADPKFVSGGYELQAGSPCIGAGNGGSDLGAFPYVAVSRIALTPSSTTVPAGGTVTFSAQAFDVNNNPLPNVAFTFSATAAAGTITPAGVLTAGCTPQTVTDGVSVSAGSVVAKATVTITAGVASRVTVTPSTASVGTQSTQSFTAAVRDGCGNALALPVTWSVTTGGGTITAAGELTTGCALGATTVTATSGSISGAATVTVVPGPAVSLSVTPAQVTLAAGATRAFTAAGADACNHPVAAVTWSSTVGTVSSSGLYTAPCQVGTYVGAVRAQSGQRQATATVEVTAGQATVVRVTPATSSLAVGGQQAFSATATDACQNPVAAQFTWTALSTAGTVSAAGLFTAGQKAGSYAQAVRAATGAASGTADVTVQPGPVASVLVSPSQVTLAARGTQQMAATAKDAYGNTTAAAVSWSVTGGGGTISASGLLTAGTAAGRYSDTVRATAGAAFGTATLTVTPGVPARVAVSPASTTLGLRGQTTFSAQVFDADSNLVQAPTTWAVSNAAAGTISAAGVFTAKSLAGDFPDLVSATAGGVVGKASVTVSPGAMARLVLTPPSASLRVGEAQHFAARGEDSEGNPMAVTPTWAVLQGGGTIDAAGNFRAGELPGEYVGTVQAQASGLAATATVVVSPGPAAKVTVSPKDVVLRRRQAMRFSAEAADRHGNSIADAGFVWSASPHAGTVDPNGVFTAGQSPGVYVGAVTAVLDAVSDSTTVTVDTEWVDGGVDVEPLPDAGSSPPDGGVLPGERTTSNTACGCGAAGALPGLWLLGLPFLLRRARRLRAARPAPSEDPEA